MAEISRRSFLARTGTAVATGGIAAMLPAFATEAGAEESSSREQVAGTGRGAELGHTDEPLVIHIPDASTGEIHYMIGAHEYVHEDKALAARLLRQAR